ncbi:MAG TPA: hypothetical protein VKE98_09690, partial [Gemmataceae bacterium]|nr:hypothetical protein [Gemmataceae bacterium]
MASQEESPIRGLATSWPALAAMAVTVLSFLLASPRLESPRPTGIGSGSKQELRTPDVPARLWQDPRTCVMQGQCQTSLDLIVKGLPPKNGDPNNVLVLLVLCEADLNPEAMENRRRERYATLAALNTAGYVPVKSERLSYVDLDLDPKADASAKHAKEGAPARNQDAKEDSACKERVRVPFEWAQPQEKSAQTGDSPKKREFRGVCVVWLYFDVDLKNLVYSLGFLKQSLGCALSCALTDGGECQFAITGRITSNMLQRIFDDDGRLEKHRHGRLEKVTLYVTYSTAKDVRHDKSHAGVKSSGASPHGPKLKVTTNSGLNLEYIIGHDEQLLHSLVGELHNRGVSGHTDQIAVISEWDTLYGRAMHKGFLDALKKQYGQSETKEEGPQEKKGSGMGDGMGGGHGGAMGGGRGDGMGGRRGDGAGGGRGPDREFRNVHLFSFLRGLDGKLPGVKTES